MSKGVKLALLTSVVSGVSIFVNKFGVSLIDSPLLYTTTKNTLVGLVILSILLGVGSIGEIKNLKKQEWLRLMLVGLVGGSLPFYLFFEGLNKVSAINAAMIHKSLFLWISVLAYPFLKEKLTRNQVLSVVMLYLTNLLIGGFSGFEFSVGEMMIIGATLLWSVENIIAKKTLSTVSVNLLAFFRMGFGAMILWVLVLASGASVSSLLQVSATDWSVMLVVSGLLMLYVITWYRALKVEKAVVVSATLVSSTIVTNILSAVFIGGNFSVEKIIQMGLILFGMMIFYREEKLKSLNLA